MSVVELSAHRDRDAIAIGKLYRNGCASIVEGVHRLLEAGQRLIAKKASLEHGEWLPWLDANADVLGFESRFTAAKLMAAAGKCVVDDTFTAKKATEISRAIWGNADPTNWNQANSNEHYTPQVYLDAARSVLGRFDLDPASCAVANRTVKARQFYSKDGESKPWNGTVWLNPPYSMAAAFIGRLVSEHANGSVQAGIALVSAHATDTAWFQPLWDYTLCFTDHRIAFSGVSGNIGGSVFAYFGNDPQRFKHAFSTHGAIVQRY